MDLTALSRIISPKYLRIFFAAVGIAVAMFLSYQRVFERYELQTYDWRFQFRGERAFSRDIVHIDIWNDTLKACGRWPFDRAYHAYLIDALKHAGAKAVLFDVEFVEKTPSDAKVAKAARDAKNVYFQEGFSNIVERQGYYEAKSLDAPLVPLFQNVSKGIGFPNMVADIDGKRRRTMPLVEYEGKPHYHQTFRFLMDELGASPDQVKFVAGKYLEFKPGYRVPLDEDGCMIIAFAGEWAKTFKHYSYIQVILSDQAEALGQKPTIDLRELRGKICIVGLTAQASFDVYANPLERIFPGVGTMSSIINAVLNRDYIIRLSRLANLLLLLLLSLLVTRVTFYKKPLKAFVYSISALTLFMLTVINVFILYGLWVDLFYPTVVMSVVYVAGTLSRVIGEMRKRELIESELKIASQIQQSFLPAAPPEHKGIRISVFMKPAKAVGGDLYTFVPLPDERLGVMVGDVSGKGTPAALFMGKTVSEFKYSARDRTDPAQVLSKLNDSIASEATGGLFVTLCYAIFDMKNLKMTFSNGGHLPLVVVHPDKRTEQLIGESGMPIGVMEGTVFANSECPIQVGDCFAFYSDGISEARNRKKDEYGVEQLEKAMLQTQTQPAQQILEYAVKGVTDFIGKADQHDDMTLIIVQITAE